MDYKAECLKEAAKSPCENRKVGCIIVVQNGSIVGRGHNHTVDGTNCEDAQGATESFVVHAEAAAIDSFNNTCKVLCQDFIASTMYVTHNPCPDCLALIRETLGAVEIIVVESFMKFDSDKLRYDLVPSEWTEGDAEVITFGAKKYKPNNWRDVDDQGRYIAALERHFIAIKKYYETGDTKWLYDKETGLHHAKHLRTNAGFIMTLTGATKDEHS